MAKEEVGLTDEIPDKLEVVETEKGSIFVRRMRKPRGPRTNWALLHWINKGRARMPEEKRFTFSRQISGFVIAATLEEAEQKTDYAINYEAMRQRGIHIEQSDNWMKLDKTEDV